MPENPSRPIFTTPLLKHFLCSTVLLYSSLSLTEAQRAGDEITFPAEAYKKLDTFEALNLEDADKLYNKKDYKGAFAAYRAYSFEFPKSKATAYVLLRMGRCLHQLEKRNAAIKSYQDVVDYFPDSVRYAAAALFHIGQCHGQNGDEEKQTAVWAKMVKDDDYVAQPNSGTALTHLGKAMQKLGRFDEAAEYHWRTAVNFAKSNHEAAREARGSVIYHYAVRKPNHDKLTEFFEATSGFGHHHAKKTPKEEPRYWQDILQTAMGAKNEEAREKACAYWTSKLGTQFPENDDLRKAWCDAMLIHEKKPKLWVQRMKDQYAKKPATVDRAINWCRWFERDEKLQAAFFMETVHPMLGGMNNEERLALMKQLKHHHYKMHDQAMQVMRTIKTNGMKDEQLLDFANTAADYLTEEEVMRHYSRLKDKMLANKARFDYYSARSGRDNKPFMEKALAEIPALRKSPKYASAELSWREAELLQGLGRHEEAIKAYNASNKQPDSTWRVIDCLQALKNYSKAVETARQLESVGGDTAAQACLRVAEIYRAAGDKTREVDQLRLVLQRYPKSGRWQSEAHNRLESYGVALKGGVSEADD